MDIITINVGHNDTEKRAKSFMRRTGMKQRTIFDARSEITQLYKVFGVPTVIIADKGGKILYRQYYIPEEKEVKPLLH